MLRNSPFPNSILGISTSFLSESLQREVKGFQYERIGADRGMLGEIFKLTIDTDTGIEFVIAKFSSQSKEAMDNAKRGGIHERELRCYDELLSQTPISVPQIYASWLDAKSSEYLILQEFIDYDQSVDQIEGITISHAKLVIKEAAAMHAYWWGNDDLKKLGWLPALNDERRRTNLTTVTKLGWGALKQIIQDEGVAIQEISENQLAEKVDSMLCSIANNQSTLIHSDLRADNLLFSPKDPSVVIVDWQGSCYAPPTFDIAYLLVQSLTVRDRREHELGLLQFFSECLANEGLIISLDEILNIYKESILYNLAVACAVPVVNDVNVPRVKNLAFSMASRALTALDDHEISLAP